MKVEVGKTYKTKAGFLATVVYDKFEGLYKDRNVLVVGHRFNQDRGVPEDTVWTCNPEGLPNGGTKADFCLVEEVLANPVEASKALDLGKSAEAMLSLRDLHHAKHKMDKAGKAELCYAFDGVTPQTYTLAGVEKELAERVKIHYRKLKHVGPVKLSEVLESLKIGEHASFLSDGTVATTSEKLWRSYSKEEVSQRLKSLTGGAE